MPIKKKENKVVVSAMKVFPGKIQETVQYPGERYKVEDLVGEEFIVHECQIQDTVKISDLEQKEFGWFRTSSSVLVDQLEQFQDELPWQATIVRRGRAYSFAAPGGGKVE